MARSSIIRPNIEAADALETPSTDPTQIRAGYSCASPKDCSMNRHLMVLLLSSTAVLGACAAGPSGGGTETVIQGPPEPVTRTVEVPVYVQVPEANPPKDKAPVRRDPLKVLAEIN